MDKATAMTQPAETMSATPRLLETVPVDRARPTRRPCPRFGGGGVSRAPGSSRVARTGADRPAAWRGVGRRLRSPLGERLPPDTRVIAPPRNQNQPPTAAIPRYNLQNVMTPTTGVPWPRADNGHLSRVFQAQKRSNGWTVMTTARWCCPSPAPRVQDAQVLGSRREFRLRPAVPTAGPQA
jgi:hypothetical protein